MSRLPFQTVPVHFSVNGSSTQRMQGCRQVDQQFNPKPHLEQQQRSIRSPHKSRWHMAADLVIMQMVLMRQIHPERAALCWQGIADTLVQRGYLEAGLTAGSVKSRFVSLMHKSFQPEVLHLPKLYDRIAICFHDEPIPQSKKRSHTGAHHYSTTLIPILSTDCAQSAFEQKSSALQLVDRAYLVAQRNEALGLHRSQRPDIVARRRHNESLQSQKPQSKQNTGKIQVLHPQLQASAHLPTPPASSDFTQAEFMQELIRREVNSATDRQETEESKSLPGQSATKVVQLQNDSSQRSRSSRKRAHSQSLLDCPISTKSTKLCSEDKASKSRQGGQQELQTLLRAEEVLGIVSDRRGVAHQLEKECTRGVAVTSGKLRFLTRGHPNRKREKCWIYERMLEVDGATTSDVNLDSVKRSTQAEKAITDYKKHITLKSTQDEFKSRKRQRDIECEERMSCGNGIARAKKMKNPRIRQVQSQHEFFLSSPSGSDREQTNKKSTRKRRTPTRLEALTQRVKSKKLTKSPDEDDPVAETHESSILKSDIVGDLWDRILKSRKEKDAIVDARAAARVAQLAQVGCFEQTGCSVCTARTVRTDRF